MRYERRAPHPPCPLPSKKSAGTLRGSRSRSKISCLPIHPSRPPQFCRIPIPQIYRRPADPARTQSRAKLPPLSTLKAKMLNAVTQEVLFHKFGTYAPIASLIEYAY